MKTKTVYECLDCGQNFLKEASVRHSPSCPKCRARGDSIFELGHDERMVSLHNTARRTGRDRDFIEV